MNLLHLQSARCSVHCAWISTAIAALLLASIAPNVQAQEKSSPAPRQEQVQTFFLKNVTQMNDLNDIQTALRNSIIRARMYANVSVNSITIAGTPEELTTAQRLIGELDLAKKYYRVTYTITDLNEGKRVGSHDISLVVVAGSKAVLKQGTRIPIVTGSAGSGSDVTTQLQYLDIGMNLEVTAYEAGLHTKIEESNISAEKSSVGIQDPVIGQTVFEGNSPLITTKAVVLGTMDVPGSTHQQQISVRAELLPQPPE